MRVGLLLPGRCLVLVLLTHQRPIIGVPLSLSGVEASFAEEEEANTEGSQPGAKV